MKLLAEHTVFISHFHSENLECVPKGRVWWRLGWVNGKVLHSMTTVHLSVYIYVPQILPLWDHRPLTGNWLQPALTEWFPSGTTCQATSLPATISYIPQHSDCCQLGESGWVPPSTSLAAPDTWTSKGVKKKEREEQGYLEGCMVGVKALLNSQHTASAAVVAFSTTIPLFKLPVEH